MLQQQPDNGHVFPLHSTEQWRAPKRIVFVRVHSEIQQQLHCWSHVVVDCPAQEVPIVPNHCVLVSPVVKQEPEHWEVLGFDGLLHRRGTQLVLRIDLSTTAQKKLHKRGITCANSIHQGPGASPVHSIHYCSTLQKPLRNVKVPLGAGPVQGGFRAPI